MENKAIRLVKNQRNLVEVKISFRISTAHNMLFLKEKLDTEQETSGEYDVLLDDCREYLNKHEVNLHETVEFFRGMHDVIVEITLMLQRNHDSNLKDDLSSELILGEIIGEYIKHFELPTGKWCWRIEEDEYNKVLGNFPVFK